MKPLALLVLILVANFSGAYVLSTTSTSGDFEWAVAWINSPDANGLYSDRGYDVASSIGATLEHRQYLWGNVELTEGVYNWLVLDHWIASLRYRGMRVSISIGPINTLDLLVPEDLQDLSLNDTRVIERYISFLKLLVARYDISYLAFSNEPNFFYRERNPSEFLNFVHEVYSRVRQLREFDGIEILGITGLTLIFEGTDIEDDLSVNFTLSMSGSYDVFGLSTYDGILGRPSPDRIVDKLKFYLSLAATDKWAIVETGVAAFEEEDLSYQITYLNTILNFGRSNNNFLFLAWINLFDYPPGYLEAEKFETTGLFYLNGTAKPVVNLFGDGVYYDLVGQFDVFSVRLLTIFNLLNLTELVLYLILRKVRR